MNNYHVLHFPVQAKDHQQQSLNKQDFLTLEASLKTAADILEQSNIIVIHYPGFQDGRLFSIPQHFKDIGVSRPLYILEPEPNLAPYFEHSGFSAALFSESSAATQFQTHALRMNETH